MYPNWRRAWIITVVLQCLRRVMQAPRPNRIHRCPCRTVCPLFLSLSSSNLLSFALCRDKRVDAAATSDLSSSKSVSFTYARSVDSAFIFLQVAATACHQRHQALVGQVCCICVFYLRNPVLISAGTKGDPPPPPCGVSLPSACLRHTRVSWILHSIFRR